ncbi:MAG TPA: 50S ribosomal protein L25/general stress protein Ctc [Geothermobacteraceae bacterium]|nr:50S ribosomal protein L25/general stress protein Ctc [Geothermobacteraceae bacterium]
MATANLTVTVREKTGKGVSRELRRQGRIPAVVYGTSMEPCPISVDPKELHEAMDTEAGLNTLLTLKGAGPFDGKAVILKEMVVGPIKREPLHADFHAIDMQRTVNVMVPVHPVGKSKGEKEGGNLEIVRHEIEVVCLPTAIPSTIEIDITALEVGDVLHVGDVALPEGVELPADVNFTVITCTAPVVEKVEDEEEGEAIEAAVEAAGVVADEEDNEA